MLELARVGVMRGMMPDCDGVSSTSSSSARGRSASRTCPIEVATAGNRVPMWTDRAMIFGTGTRATYTMSLPSSCDIELDSPVCATSASRCGRASSQMPSAAMYVVPSSSTFVVRVYTPLLDRTYPNFSSVSSSRLAVGRGSDVRAAASLTVSAVAVGLNAVMIARPRARASTKSVLGSRGIRASSHDRTISPRHHSLSPTDHGESRTPMTSAPSPDRRGPLDGLLVADMSRVLAGPYCSMLLGDMGATVIKVEGPGGDDTRTWVPPVKDGVSTYYLSIGRNKRSVVLDFRDPDDRALAAELLQRADVAIENFKPGALGKFGLEYETVAESNPGLVYLSISGFGTAEGAWLPGYDLIVQAVSGLMSLTGDPDGPAFRAGISVFDVMAGLHGLIGVLAALHQRTETGRGQHVEVNLLSSAMSGLVNQTAAYTAGGVVPQRMGNAHPSLFPYEVMPTADRDMIITAGNDRQFRSLCEVLGLTDVADDPRFGSNADRTRNRDELRPLLLAELARWKADDLFLALNKAGVPCGPINTIGEGVELAESLGLAPRVELGAGDRAVTLVRNPISVRRRCAALRPPAARPGRARRRDQGVAARQPRTAGRRLSR